MDTVTIDITLMKKIIWPQKIPLRMNTNRDYTILATQLPRQ